MKRKIIIGLGTLVLSALIVMNISLIKNGEDFKFELSSILRTALAYDEEPEEGFNRLCKWDDCSVTIEFVTYYGHYQHCGYGEGEYCLFTGCFIGCDAL